MTNDTKSTNPGSFDKLIEEILGITKNRVTLVLVGVVGARYNEEPCDIHCPNRPVEKCVDECIRYARKTFFTSETENPQHIKTPLRSKSKKYHEFWKKNVNPDLIPIGTKETQTIWSAIEAYGFNLFELFDPFTPSGTMLPFVKYSCRDTVPPKEFPYTCENNPSGESEVNFDYEDVYDANPDFSCTERRADRELVLGELKQETSSFPIFETDPGSVTTNDPMQWFCEVIVRDFVQAARCAIMRKMKSPDSASGYLGGRKNQPEQLMGAPDSIATQDGLQAPECSTVEDSATPNAAIKCESGDETPMHPKDWKTRQLSDSMPAWEREPPVTEYQHKDRIGGDSSLERDRWLYWTLRNDRFVQWEVVLEANKHWRIGERNRGEVEEQANTNATLDTTDNNIIEWHRRAISQNLSVRVKGYANNYATWAGASVLPSRKKGPKKPYK